MLPDRPTLPSILAHHFYTQPERTAIILAARQGDSRLTWRDLWQGSAAYARRYEAAGVLPGEVVINLLPPGPHLLYGFLGAMLRGAVPSILPFPTEKLDPALHRASLMGLLAVTRPTALLAEAALAAELRRTLPPNSLRAILEPETGEPHPANEGEREPWAGLAAAPQDVALLQHSSGTTGLQKGVALSHRAILNQVAAYAAILRLNDDDVAVNWLPLYHDMGLIAGFLLPLLCGLPLVLLSPFEWVRAPALLLQAVHRHRGTLTWLPNFAYNFCAQKIPDSALAGLNLSSWRAVVNCSEPMYAESHRMFRERFTPHGLRPEALQTCYAMAENVFAVTHGGADGPVVVDRVDAEQAQTQGRAAPAISATRRVTDYLSAGPPLPNCRVRVLDAEGRELAEREIGELALQSDCMLTGYYNRPEATAQAMRDGWYLTGDLGYLADGHVYITGRKKDLMIVGGKNVYPQDIEQIINTVPGVHAGRAVVFGVPNPQLGTEEVAAVVETEAQGADDAATLSLAIRQAVAAGSEVVLRHLKLAQDRWLVKTSSGKIARAANRDKFLAELD